MTRQEKIRNIIDGTMAAINTMKKTGTLTEEIHAAVIDNMNHIIAAVAEQ